MAHSSCRSSPGRTGAIFCGGPWSAARSPPSPTASRGSRRSTSPPSRERASKSGLSSERRMKWKKGPAVVPRGYIERIRTKAFWVGTLIIPFLFIALIVIQIAVARKAGGERRVAVVDRTGHLFAPLQAELVRLTTPKPAGERIRPAEPDEVDRAASETRRNIRGQLKTRPASGDLEKIKEDLRKEVVAKKIHAYLLLEPALLAKGRVEYYSTTVSEFSAMNQLERAINHVL